MTRPTQPRDRFHDEDTVDAQSPPQIFSQRFIQKLEFSITPGQGVRLAPYLYYYQFVSYRVCKQVEAWSLYLCPVLSMSDLWLNWMRALPVLGLCNKAYARHDARHVRPAPPTPPHHPRSIRFKQCSVLESLNALDWLLLSHGHTTMVDHKNAAKYK